MSQGNVTACPACAGTVSQDAYSCPQCGKPLRVRPIDIMAIVYVASTVAGLSLLSLIVVSYSAVQAPIAMGFVLAVVIMIGGWIVFRKRARR
jgi:hypothetical protein